MVMMDSGRTVDAHTSNRCENMGNGGSRERGQMGGEQGGKQGSQHGQQQNQKQKKHGKRNNGSKRKRKAKDRRVARWKQNGLTIGSINISGLSYFKLFIILEQHELDVLCIQETWLSQEAMKPRIPGFNLLESRRTGNVRGGIAMYIRSSLKIEIQETNEFAILARLALPDSSRANIASVYLPPRASKAYKDIKETQKRKQVQNVLNKLQEQYPTVICGDFNTRIGNKAPQIADTEQTRHSQDTHVCTRAKWLLDLCEKHKLHILNGLHSEAHFTFKGPQGKSVIDLILSNDASLCIKQDEATNDRVSDHDLVYTHLPFSYNTTPQPPVHMHTQDRTQQDNTNRPHPPPYLDQAPIVHIKWNEGQSVREYGDSAKKWTEHSSTDQFIQQFTTLVSNTSVTNEDRAAQVEAFLIDEAVKSGAIQKIEITRAKNPNRWVKHMAPWFTDECKKFRKELRYARRTNGNDSTEADTARAEYRRACRSEKNKFEASLPHMLKYSPKQFWGMLKRKNADEVQVPIQKVIEYNKSIFYDPSVEADNFEIIENQTEHEIKTAEVTAVLEQSFKPNKSSGNSKMPLQVLKHIGTRAHTTLAEFLNASAIKQKAPQAWRDTKIVPLYKGKGSKAEAANYRSIAITPPFPKLMMQIVTKRLQALAHTKSLYAPTQAGFRPHHTTIEQALILQTLIQYSIRAHKQLAIAFIDLKRAYDSVQRRKLWTCLSEELELPKGIVQIIKNMYINSQGTVYDSNTKQQHVFQTNIGVKQGDGASPTLFVIFIDRIYPYIKQYCAENTLNQQTLLLFTLAALQLFLLAFADDLALVAQSPQQLQLLLNCVQQFCGDNNLVINTDKTKYMLINSTGQIICNNTQLEQVKDFTYLGIKLSSTCNKPVTVIQDRIQQATRNFNAIKSNCKLLNIHNARVKVQLINSLVVSTLTYGSVIYACLSNKQTTLQPKNSVFKSAEVLIRKMLRWSLNAKIDTRCSILYTMSNQVNLQLLSFKSCFRFFQSLEQHPRFASQFVQNIGKCIDSRFIGTSTITWWSDVRMQYRELNNTKGFYKDFRKCITTDIKKSVRIRQLGVQQLLTSMIQYSFAGEQTTPPNDVKHTLYELLAPSHAITVINRRNTQIIQIAQWPSWLTTGYKKYIDLFYQFFYGEEQLEVFQNVSTCRLCNQTIDEPIWQHIFKPCKKLNTISANNQWQAFVQLLNMQYQGLAMYTCFPLFGDMYETIVQQTCGDLAELNTQHTGNAENTGCQTTSSVSQGCGGGVECTS